MPPSTRFRLWFGKKRSTKSATSRQNTIKKIGKMPEEQSIDIEKVADLARIALTNDEKSKLSSQLDSILEYINKLNELDTDNVEPTAHPHSVFNVWREDKTETELPIEEALKNAPKQRQNMIVVPKVVE